MKTAGIVAEYNPFHNGHKYHIEQTRKITGAEGIITVMSGNFVQRGEYALCDKWTRAEMALLGGADLVIELPQIYACQSAEYFCAGAVNTLESLNCNFLSFGSETDDIDSLIKLAEFLKNPDTEFKTKLAYNLEQGLSYPKAVADAMDTHLLDTPNNVLGTEYIKSIKKMTPVCIKRVGSEHDSKGSASDIRGKISACEDISHLVPETTLKLLNKASFADKSVFEKLVLYKLRTIKHHELENIPDVTEGLENRIIKLCHKHTSLKMIIEDVKTKRYTMARIRRIITNALLGITKDDIKSMPEYIRVLGMNKRGMDILSELRNKTDIPIITKVADASKSRSLEIDINATNIYSLLTGKDSMLDLTTSPVVVKE